MYTVEYYSAIKKNEIMPFAATWMDLEIIILSEVNQERERQITYDITYMWTLKYGTKWKQTHGHKEQTCGCQGGGRVEEGRIGSLGLVDANCYI